MSQKIVAVYRGQKNSFLSSEYGYDMVRVEQASDKKSFFRILKKLLPSRNLAAIWFTDFCSLSEGMEFLGQLNSDDRFAEIPLIVSVRKMIVPEEWLSSYASQIIEYPHPEDIENRLFDEIANGTLVDLRAKNKCGKFIIGSSQELYQQISEISEMLDHASTVLIKGETGTGKTILAKGLHRKSHLRNGPFVDVNCAGIPETLIESELFGHERGAFTGAEFKKIGLFSQAENGTIFLDEIGEMPMRLQTKLLKVVEEKRLRPVGGLTEKSFNCNIFCATNLELEKAVAAGRFRSDLYHRISEMEIDLVPLRNRLSDLPLLTASWWVNNASRLKIKGVDYEVFERLWNYDFPGNVRELNNILFKSSLKASGKNLGAEHLPSVFSSSRSEGGFPRKITSDIGDLNFAEARLRFEKKLVEHYLRISDGKIAPAARAAGLSRRGFYKLMERVAES